MNYIRDLVDSTNSKLMAVEKAANAYQDTLNNVVKPIYKQWRPLTKPTQT